MALWGGRFEEETNREVAKYTESISFDRRLFRHDIAGSIAHVHMLARQNIIPQATSEAIERELLKIRDRMEKGDFEYSIELEDIHMHIESALIGVLGAEGARVHSARSRNDQVAVDVRLYLRDQIDLLLEKVEFFQKILVERAETDKRAIMPGFTHLQHAQVVLFAHHLLAYVEMFGRDAERLRDCRVRLNRMPLGAGAIAGSTLPIDRASVAEELHFAEVTRNSMDSVADRDFALELLSDLAIFGIHISRLSEDIILWSSQEFDFVELSDDYCTGSSLMPQKKNPDVAELSRGKSARLTGDLMTLLTMCKGLPLTYNRDLQEDKLAIFDALDTATAILTVYPGMIAKMKIKADHMRARAADPYLMATDMAEELVRLGVPFRTAHSRVGSLVKYCRENNTSPEKLTLAQMRESIPEATEAFLNLFDPEASVAKRESEGGTGFRSVERQIAYWKERLA
ncbi:MAG: argininosuccinate lyase [Victivallaceae bacterium]|nr:argininosuccinate lyase [Victivallaceae bacterium]